MDKDGAQRRARQYGSTNAGIDGVTKADWTSEGAKRALVHEIEQELRERNFRPSPVRRVHIPKSNGTYRPLGLSPLKDRVVQMLLKMVLEPIWESDFLNCSNGFRPRRRAMDCIALLDSYINERNKYFWVIEGDIRAAFRRIQPRLALDPYPDGSRHAPEMAEGGVRGSAGSLPH
jgi:RNA-directed DNA polymerase